MYRFTREDNAEAQNLFRRAVTLDPGFARGYAGFADSLYFAMMHGYSASHAESLGGKLPVRQTWPLGPGIAKGCHYRNLLSGIVHIRMSDDN